MLLVLTACHGGDAGSHAGGLERSIQRGLAAQLGVQVTAVACAGARCTATLAGGGTLPVAVHGKDWELDGLAIASAPLEAYVRDLAADLGLPVAVDCGPRVRAAQVGDRIECSLGAAGRAFATVRAGGDFTVELAIGPDAVAAREAPADEQALDRASLALDRASAGSGAGDEEGGDGADVIDGGAPAVDAR
jgi:hypothetical protein